MQEKTNKSFQKYVTIRLVLLNRFVKATTVGYGLHLVRFDKEAGMICCKPFDVNCKLTKALQVGLFFNRNVL